MTHPKKIEDVLTAISVATEEVSEQFPSEKKAEDIILNLIKRKFHLSDSQENFIVDLLGKLFSKDSNTGCYDLCSNDLIIDLYQNISKHKNCSYAIVQFDIDNLNNVSKALDSNGNASNRADNINTNHLINIINNIILDSFNQQNLAPSIIQYGNGDEFRILLIGENLYKTPEIMQQVENELSIIGEKLGIDKLEHSKRTDSLKRGGFGITNEIQFLDSNVESSHEIFIKMDGNINEKKKEKIVEDTKTLEEYIRGHDQQAITAVFQDYNTDKISETTNETPINTIYSSLKSYYTEKVNLLPEDLKQGVLTLINDHIFNTKFEKLMHPGLLENEIDFAKSNNKNISLLSFRLSNSNWFASNYGKETALLVEFAARDTINKVCTKFFGDSDNFLGVYVHHGEYKILTRDVAPNKIKGFLELFVKTLDENVNSIPLSSFLSTENKWGFDIVSEAPNSSGGNGVKLSRAYINTNFTEKLTAREILIKNKLEMRNSLSNKAYVNNQPIWDIDGFYKEKS